MRKCYLILLICVLAVALGSATVQAVSPFSNGSFEEPSSTPIPGGYLNLVSPNSDIAAWTVVSGNIDWISTYWTTPFGARSLDMSGTDAGSISQLFATTSGQKYEVTFYMAGNPDGGLPTKHLNVSAWAASTDYTFNTGGHSDTSMGWTKEFFYFTALSGATTLTFTSGDHSNAGPALDNVSVPLPPSALLLGSGLLGLVGLRRKLKG